MAEQMTTLAALKETAAYELAVAKSAPMWSNSEDDPNERAATITKAGLRMRRKRSRDKASLRFWTRRLINGCTYLPELANCSALRIMESRATAISNLPAEAEKSPERAYITGVTFTKD